MEGDMGLKEEAPKGAEGQDWSILEQSEGGVGADPDDDPDDDDEESESGWADGEDGEDEDYEEEEPYHDDEGRLCRRLKTMPYDKAFEVDDGEGSYNEELCHATGIEVYFGDDDEGLDSGEWWNEYEDRNGEYHYGR